MNNTAVEIVGVVALVILNAFFVVAEFAIVKVRDTRIAELKATGSRRATVADHIVNHLDAYLSATQLGVTVASMGLGWLGAEASKGLFGTAMNPVLAAALAFVIVTFITIIFGELVPKSVAIRKAERAALWVALPSAVVLLGHPTPHLAHIHIRGGCSPSVPHPARLGARLGAFGGGAAHDPGGQPRGGPHRRGRADPHAQSSDLR